MAMTRAEALAAVALRYPDRVPGSGDTTPAPKPPPQPPEPVRAHRDAPQQLTLFTISPTSNPQPGAHNAVTH